MSSNTLIKSVAYCPFTIPYLVFSEPVLAFWRHTIVPQNLLPRLDPVECYKPHSQLSPHEHRLARLGVGSSTTMVKVAAVLFVAPCGIKTQPCALSVLYLENCTNFVVIGIFRLLLQSGAPGVGREVCAVQTNLPAGIA